MIIAGGSGFDDTVERISGCGRAFRRYARAARSISAQ
jgi:hypothetical protein